MAKDVRRRAALGLLAAGPLAATASAALAATSEDNTPLCDLATRRGLFYGSSAASWQLADRDYRTLHARQAGALLTEDDLLWYRLKPTPRAPLDFSRADRVVALAERAGQRVVGAHLVWDEGFGPGWPPDHLRSLGARRATRLLHGVVEAQVRRYRGRMAAWVVANEVSDGVRRDRHGLRTDVPWYETIGPDYVADAFHLVAQTDPAPLRILNEFGCETRAGGLDPEPRRRAFLDLLDHLLDRGAPVGAVGLQGHLVARRMADGFDDAAYRRFLARLAERGLPLLVTELDVVDTGLPAAIGPRDRAVAAAYRRFLDVVLDEPAVVGVLGFGLSDRYSWLEEDRPRADGRHRRPLPYDRGLRPTPARDAVAAALRAAPDRRG